MKIAKNNELTETDYKYATCYYLDDTLLMTLILVILYWPKNYIIFFYQDVYKAPYATKHLHFVFDKVDGYIGKYHGTKYLPLFPSDEKYERMFGRTR